MMVPERVTQVDLLVGARPNFVKAAPVHEELRRRRPDWRVRLIHSGQHYDDTLSSLLFGQLGLPSPDLNLQVGSGPHVAQTAQVMIALEQEFLARRPDLLVVFGDVNSTLAGAIAASKMLIPVAHVESGLRSFDRTMPEEINRVLTDAVAEVLFTTEPQAGVNLVAEGVPPDRIHFVGNTMVDTLLKYRDAALRLNAPARFGLAPRRYVVVTLHRPSNVDDPGRLGRIMDMLATLAGEIDVVFPMHPRTRARLDSMEWKGTFPAALRLWDPLGYLEFIGLMAGAAAVLTDSGGIQEESTVLGIPCVTLRRNTERPITLTSGTNVLAGDDPIEALRELRKVLAGTAERPNGVIEKWDGLASRRVVDVLEQVLGAATVKTGRTRRD